MNNRNLRYEQSALTQPKNIQDALFDNANSARISTYGARGFSIYVPAWNTATLVCRVATEDYEGFLVDEFGDPIRITGVIEGRWILAPSGWWAAGAHAEIDLVSVASGTLSGVTQNTTALVALMR